MPLHDATRLRTSSDRSLGKYASFQRTMPKVMPAMTVIATTNPGQRKFHIMPTKSNLAPNSSKAAYTTRSGAISASSAARWRSSADSSMQRAAPLPKLRSLFASCTASPSELSCDILSAQPNVRL